MAYVHYLDLAKRSSSLVVTDKFHFMLFWSNMYLMSYYSDHFTLV